MSGIPDDAVEAFRAAVGSRVLSPEGDVVLAEVAQQMALAARGTLDGLVFFGSRRTGAAGIDAWSAYDVFVLVHRYRPFYEAMQRAGLSGKGPGRLALLSGWLPPTQYSIRFHEAAVHLKAAVIRTDSFHRETSRGRRDHFCIGRLFQPVEVVWTRDAETAERVLALLESAVRETAAWIHSSTPETFTAEAYVHALLRVSLAGEIRPEPASRAERLLDAQRDAVVPLYGELLRDLESRGMLVSNAEEEWRWARPASAWESLRTRGYFLRSKIRATLRWSKYMITFEGWLDYLLRKIARHTGEQIVLSDRERRFPLVFLWPRFFRYLREKERRVSR